MLFRQRLILGLLEAAGRPLRPTALVKLAFLLRHETPIGGDHAFYGFVPYRYGPFSFGLYRELSSLERDGYVRRSEKSVSLNPDARDVSRLEIAQLTKAQESAVDSIVSEYGRMRYETLLRSLYRRYPWYAQKSELSEFVPDDVPKPPRPPAAAYTVGYEGKSVDEFFNDLLTAGMTAILDVRSNPVSRKYGFARRSLSHIAEGLGLRYHHLPELGIVGEHRSQLSDFDSYQKLLDEYEERMLPSKKMHVRQVTDLLASQPSALLCVEKDVRCCHRGRLAKHVARETGLPVVHL